MFRRKHPSGLDDCVIGWLGLFWPKSKIPCSWSRGLAHLAACNFHSPLVWGVSYLVPQFGSGPIWFNIMAYGVALVHELLLMMYYDYCQNHSKGQKKKNAKKKTSLHEPSDPWVAKLAKKIVRPVTHPVFCRDISLDCNPLIRILCNSLNIKEK